jgi:putative ABC transport system substrate-binding protein
MRIVLAAARFALLALALVAGLPAAQAQSPPTRVGVLGPGEEPRFSELVASLSQGLREQGYRAVEVLEGRVRRGDTEGARVAVKGFIEARVAVIFAIGSVLARIAGEVAPAVPIVFITPGDPVAAGLVASLARPAGKMTAVTFEYPELSGKRLELLVEIAPRTRRVLVLYDPRDASPRQGVTAAREAAATLGLTLVEREVRSEGDVTRALTELDQVDALLEVPGGLTSDHHGAMIRASNAKRRPTVFHTRTRITHDALITYGASDADIARQAARLVDKVLKGANAGELPVERPTKITLVINRGTARALGLTIPPSILARADQVIDQ